MEKFVEREKAFGKKTTPRSSEEVVCLAHREKDHAQDSSRGRGGRRGRVVEISKYYPLEILVVFFWFISPTC